MMSVPSKPLLQPFIDPDKRSPIWLMRQAGRYLPEYRKLRQTHRSFLDLCLHRQAACEVTLQPLLRFNGLDGAILFSDILLIAYGLGQDLIFDDSKGPILGDLPDIDSLSIQNDRFFRLLETTAAIVHGVKRELPKDKALIGFCGGVWTLAAYMIQAGTKDNFQSAKLYALERESDFERLVDCLIEASITWLANQIEAGAEVVQIFDSWSGILDVEMFNKVVIVPTRRIVTALRKRYKNIKIIGFPRGCGLLYPKYGKETGVDGLAIDYQVPLSIASQWQNNDNFVIQGNLDPMVLVAGGAVLENRIKAISQAFSVRKAGHIFNLGHGILPQTPLDHVDVMIDTWHNLSSREWR